MHHQDSAPATYKDLLDVLAAGLQPRAGARAEPISMQVDRYHTVYVHTETSADAAAWEQHWDRRGAHSWSDEAREAGGFTHHHRTGTWRNATVDIVHLTPADQPAEEVVPV